VASLPAVRIPDELLAELYEHACQAFPAECCGYLVRPRDRYVATAIIRCRNAQPDGDHPTHPERPAETGFVIAGAELLAFARSFSTDAPACVIYHSHTNGRAYFSAVDRAVACAGGSPTYPVEHLVVGVTAQGVTEAAQFAWSTDHADFVEIARWAIPARGC
jgi:proteasome lid subunit RPN8/RPN11